MIKKRECGNCSLCCEVMAVEDINKKEYQKCENQGLGCRIHNEKPDQCKSFACAWLEGNIPYDLKPDNVGFFVTSQGTEDYPLVSIHSKWSLDKLKKRKLATQWLDAVTKSVPGVFVGANGKRTLFGNPEVIKKAVLNAKKKLDNVEATTGGGIPG